MVTQIKRKKLQKWVQVSTLWSFVTDGRAKEAGGL